MTKKIDKLSDHYSQGDYKKALHIASKFFFGFTREEKAVIDRGYECYVRPEFYKSLGYDAEECKRVAIDLLKARYKL